MNLYGLIGYPLGHSFSKQYFTQKFEKEGLEDCFFELYPLEKIEEFPGLLQKQPLLRGVAVTIPYKEAVIPFLHSMSPQAKSIGAVNCIEVLPGGLRGHNTDVVGFERSFVPSLQHHHTRALILGTGGASKAVQYVLQQLGIPFLLVSRKAKGDTIIGYNQVTGSLLKDYTILINCTPVGMAPHENEKPPLPYEELTFVHYLYDLVYKPAETQFMLEGKKKGAVVKNGYDMLLIQADENWKIWNEM